MIDITYDVECDGEDCEAHFSHFNIGKVSDLSGLVRQLRDRGWRRVRSGRVYCPLHRKATDDDT